MDDPFVYPEVIREPSPPWGSGANPNPRAESSEDGLMLDLASPIIKRRRFYRPTPREGPTAVAHISEAIKAPTDASTIAADPAQPDDSSEDDIILDLAPPSKKRLLCRSTSVGILDSIPRCKAASSDAVSTRRAIARAAAVTLPSDTRNLYARSKVFAVTELTTLILDHLPPRDLLVLQSVNSKFRDLITTLPDIGLRLGFTEKPLPPGYFPAEMTASTLEFFPKFIIDIGIDPLTGLGFAVFDRVDLEFHPDPHGSWRDMMPFQPATKFMKMRGAEHYDDEIPRRIENREEGVRLGDMVDALLKEHAADVDLYIAHGQGMMPLSFVFEITEEIIEVENNAD
ncbi:unnamed protein product [Zymoseptoria tritici ST99CH_1A5]|uniref:F-box domain-containing protein n=1 Tax=Zymoseptoria tritici ST99CH_1A5 TaxID=1276529 RepID=A0A1Y6L9B8_ZYMTR|nr:unnamed protein product [Zymoseptoria tritici ST99CH_1A5]